MDRYGCILLQAWLASVRSMSVLVWAFKVAHTVLEIKIPQMLTSSRDYISENTDTEIKCTRQKNRDVEMLSA